MLTAAAVLKTIIQNNAMKGGGGSSICLSFKENRKAYFLFFANLFYKCQNIHLRSVISEKNWSRKNGNIVAKYVLLGNGGGG